EDSLKTDVLALIERHILLQKLLVALFLDVDQVRNVDDLGDLRVALPDAEIVLNHRCHEALTFGHSCATSAEAEHARTREPGAFALCPVEPSLLGAPPPTRPPALGTCRALNRPSSMRNFFSSANPT